MMKLHHEDWSITDFIAFFNSLALIYFILREVW